MSLREAYTLAHSAQCRLQVEASRPDRNLRFLVGHLLHYENMRLRIVEIEDENAGPTRHIRRPSPMPTADKYSELNDLDDDEEDDDDSWSDEDSDDYEQDKGEDEGLGLQRFPSASAKPQRHSHTATDNDSKKQHDTAPVDPTQDELERALKSPQDPNMVELYRTVRGCPCNEESDAPAIERGWEIPSDPSSQDGVMRIVVEVGA